MHIDEEIFQREDFKRNLKLYEEAMKKGKKVFMDIDDMTDIIDYYNYDGRIEEATRMADYALELYPGAIGPHVFKERQAIAVGDIEEGKRQCEAIDDKNDIDYFYLRAELEIAQQNYDTSEKMIEEAYANTMPEDKEHFLLDISALYVDYNVVDLGEKWLAMMEDKNNRERLELVARIHCSRNRFDEAIKVLESLLDNNPFVYRYWNTLGIIHLCENNFDECRNCAEYSLAINPGNTDGLWCMAKALEGQGQIQEAVDAFEKFIKKMPNCARAEIELGSCLLQAGEAQKAKKWLEKAIRDYDGDRSILSQAYDDLAFIYSNKKEFGKALECLDNADIHSTFADEMPEARYQRIVLRGHVYLMNNQTDEALKLFEKAVKQSQRNPEIIFKVMVSLFDHSLYEQVLTYFRKLVRVMPEGWNLGYSYAAASCLRTMDISKGVNYLKKACQINPDEVELIFGDFFPSGITKEKYYEYIKNVKL